MVDEGKLRINKIYAIFIWKEEEWEYVSNLGDMKAKSFFKYYRLSGTFPKTIAESKSEANFLKWKFLWRESTNERKLHLIGWQQVTMSKISRGLWLQNLDIINKVCVARLSWKMHASYINLCNEFLLWKYVTNREEWVMITRPNDSALWKGIVRVMCELNDHSFRVLGDGKTLDASSK